MQNCVILDLLVQWKREEELPLCWDLHTTWLQNNCLENSEWEKKRKDWTFNFFFVQRYDASKTDVFAFGILLLELVTRRTVNIDRINSREPLNPAGIDTGWLKENCFWGECVFFVLTFCLQPGCWKRFRKLSMFLLRCWSLLWCALSTIQKSVRQWSKQSKWRLQSKRPLRPNK